MTPTTDGRTRLGHAEYRLFPSDGGRHEVIDGDHYVNPAPETYHQTVSRRIQFQLYRQIEEAGVGQVFDAPTDLELTPHDIVQPDLIVILASQEQIVTPTKIEGVPALVVEILASSNRDYDRQLKLGLYQRPGVPEYWVVDPEEHVVEQHILEDGRYRLAGAHAESIEFQGLPGTTVDLGKVW